MSDSSENQQPQPVESQTSEFSEPNPTGAETEESAWSDVEAELSRPPERDSSVDDASQPEFSSVASGSQTRTFDPSTPLVMVETAFLASVSSLIWLINYYFPLGPVLRVFFPIPIALAYLRWGPRAAWMATLVSGLLLSVLMGPTRSILFTIPFGLMGVLLGLLWHRRAGWSMAIVLSGLLGSLGFFFRIWLTSILLGEDLWLYSTTQVTELLEWLFVKLGLLVQPSLWLVQLSVLGMVLLNNLVYTFVVHLVAWFLLDRLGNPITRPPKWVQVLMDYEG